MPTPERLAAEIKSRPPVLLVHGDSDELIPVQALFQAAQALAALDVPVEWHMSAGVGHGIDQEGLRHGGEFLARAACAPERRLRHASIAHNRLSRASQSRHAPYRLWRRRCARGIEEVEERRLERARIADSGFPALVLNADFRPLSYYPLSLWSWQDAIKAVFLERVNIVAQYDQRGAQPRASR